MILTIDPRDRSENNPIYLASPAKVLKQYNLHHATVKTRINHEVLDWFVASAKKDGWDVATVKGHQVLLIKNFGLLPHQKSDLGWVKQTGLALLTSKHAGKTVRQI
jgi:hypothetical protein